MLPLILFFYLLNLFLVSCSGIPGKGVVPLNPEQIPNPFLHYSGCGRDKPSAVCDPYNVLSQQTLLQLDSIIHDLQHNFSPRTANNFACGIPGKGFQLGVLVIPKMGSSLVKGLFYDKLAIAAEFATKVFNYWSIGEVPCQNGVLLFVSIEDRVVYIATGEESRKRVTDLRAAKIVKFYMRNFLRKEEYSLAVITGVKTIEMYLRGNTDIEDRLDAFMMYFVLPMFISMFIGVIMYAVYMDFLKDREYRLAKKRIHKLENDREKLKDNKYEMDSCPICLEDLTFNVPTEVVNFVNEAVRAKDLELYNSRRNISKNSDNNNDIVIDPVGSNNEAESGSSNGWGYYRKRAFSMWKRTKQAVGFETVPNPQVAEWDEFNREFEALPREHQWTAPRRRFARLNLSLNDRRRNPDRVVEVNDEPRVSFEDPKTVNLEASHNAFAINCGHIFCENCIKTWLSHKDTCPVCKQKVIDAPLDESETNLNAAEPANVARNREALLNNEHVLRPIENRRHMNAHLRQFEHDLFWNEVCFRTHRIHVYHPVYVNHGMVEHFASEPQKAYLSRHEHFIASQTAHMNRNNGNGHKSHGGFGGGFASGGGGGSW